MRHTHESLSVTAERFILAAVARGIGSDTTTILDPNHVEHDRFVEDLAGAEQHCKAVTGFPWETWVLNRSKVLACEGAPADLSWRLRWAVNQCVQHIAWAEDDSGRVWLASKVSLFAQDRQDWCYLKNGVHLVMFALDGKMIHAVVHTSAEALTWLELHAVATLPWQPWRRWSWLDHLEVYA